MSDRVGFSLQLSDKDALVFRNRSHIFNKDITTFAIDPLGKIAVLCGYVDCLLFYYHLSMASAALATFSTFPIAHHLIHSDTVESIPARIPTKVTGVSILLCVPTGFIEISLSFFHPLSSIPLHLYCSLTF